MGNIKINFFSLVKYIYKHTHWVDIIVILPFLIFDFICILLIIYFYNNVFYNLIVSHLLLFLIICIFSLKICFHVLLEKEIGFKFLASIIKPWSDKKKIKFMLFIQLFNLNFLLNYISTEYFYKFHAWLEDQNWIVKVIAKILWTSVNLISMSLSIMYYGILNKFKLPFLEKIKIYSSTSVFLLIWIWYLGSPLQLLKIAYIVLILHLIILSLIDTLVVLVPNLKGFNNNKDRILIFVKLVQSHIYMNYGARFYNGQLFTKIHVKTSYFIIFFEKYIFKTLVTIPSSKLKSESIFEIFETSNIFQKRPILHMRYCLWDKYDLKGFKHLTYNDWVVIDNKYFKLYQDNYSLFLSILKNNYG